MIAPRHETTFIKLICISKHMFLHPRKLHHTMYKPATLPLCVTLLSACYHMSYIQAVRNVIQHTSSGANPRVRPLTGHFENNCWSTMEGLRVADIKK